jgi:drug/metabolite transporter (DMT)-like permease
MSILTLCIIASATIAYTILIFQTLKKNQKEEDKVSFSSFLLWLIIDVIMFVNTLRAKNDPTLIGTYTALTVILTGLLFYKKQFSWNKTDTKVAVLAFACLVISYMTGPIVGVTCAALSIGCAGIPNLIGISNKKPSKLLYFTIIFFLLGPLFSVISVTIKNGLLKDYIYPCIAMTYWSIALVITTRNEYKK